MTFDQQNELQLLEAIQEEGETTQTDLAVRAGLAVGTVNWYLKRWTAKGYVKVKRIGRWRWRYLLTPQGMAEKARLASKYVDASMKLYRRTRVKGRELLTTIEEIGYRQVFIDGEGDIADICRLTCLELGIEVVAQKNDEIPILIIQGPDVTLKIPKGETGGVDNKDG